MGESQLLERLAREPLYNTRAVAQATGVPADTFRAWERRYGLPRPYRTPAKQRLYTERDIGIINWLRDRTDEGMTISQAIQRLKLEVPEMFVADHLVQPAAPALDGTSQAARLRERLIDAVIAFDSVTADRTLDDALARYSVEAFCSQIVEPAFEEIRLRRCRREISVAAEYLAGRLLERRLVSLLAMATPLSGRGTIVAASPLGEEQAVGLLVLSIAIARRGWQICYLGVGVPADALVDIACAIHPDAVCLLATGDNAMLQAGFDAEAVSDSTDRDLLVVVGRSASEVRDRLIEVVDGA